MIKAMINPNESFTVYIAGDSTAAPKEEDKRPETGWGEKFPAYLGPAVRVENRAVNGRSTKTFIEEGRLASIAETLKSGDYLFIQFGHNDAKENSERYTDPRTAYPANLFAFAETARAAGAIPVLLTPVVRRRFDETGALQDTHGPYLEAMKRLAAERSIPLLDLEARTRNLVAGMGETESRALYLHAKSGQWPAYPEGIADDTHFSPVGADWVASLAASEILRAAPLYPELEPLARAVLVAEILH